MCAGSSHGVHSYASNLDSPETCQNFKKSLLDGYFDSAGAVKTGLSSKYERFQIRKNLELIGGCALGIER